MMRIILNDGSARECAEGISAFELARQIDPALSRAALAAKINGKTAELSAELKDGDRVEFLTFEQEDGRRVFFHTASHVMAAAVKRLFPQVKLAIGPAVDMGFYYDFDIDRPFAQEDLAAIEKEMQKIVKEDFRLERFELAREEALALMRDEPYKLELIRDLPEGEGISFYKMGGFTDLCAGPHLFSTGKIKAFRLLQIAGAYWRGNEKNKMLRRIYGTAFEKKADLDAYLAQQEEARRRDHNKLGRELSYFTTADIIGQGLPIIMHNGAKVIQILQRFVEDEQERRGYELTRTPMMAKKDLYQISGHWDHYRDGMFILGDPDKDEEVFALRPMTCPFQFQAYLNRMRSYRDLPLRYQETSTLFRNEASGEMHGLIRLRQFTISEGHIACRPDQLEKEFKDCVDLAMFMLKAVGLDGDVSFRFSKWDKNNREKYIGSPDEWERVQDTMRQILDHMGINYQEADGEAAFYGPKLDIQIRNVFGKEDTLVTVQIDFLLAQRFEMNYVDTDGSKKYPYVIHRTSIGCYERTLALLIEKYAGALPLWLSPVQARILTITDRAGDYAQSVARMMRQSGIRVEADLRNEKIGFKIREAQVQKMPYMLVLGDKEVENGVVAVRSRRDGDLGAMDLAALIAKLSDEIKTRAL